MRIPITATLLLSFINTFAQSINNELKITPLTGDFYIYNTYKLIGTTKQEANGMYLVTDKGVVLFDSPWDTCPFQPLLDSIEARHHKKVIMCIATHSHEDRTSGLDYYRQKGIKTYTSKQTDEISKEKERPRAEFLFSKDTVFTVGKYSFATYYGGEGHTKDNIVIWFEKQKLLYGGCLVKSAEAKELGYIAEANLIEWPKTIKKIQTKFKNPAYIIPGHYDWSSTKALDHTLTLLSEHGKK
ncbi:MAG TPA: BlaB/IND/MUS family subclass B1 metallo-beta-lactamase [Cyclobacteriaceae bacterium]|nr:BlaB/IND/MUS family subclass B1 metallo-beta-lactamase [Cyclobacteriaceae bacterium]